MDYQCVSENPGRRLILSASLSLIALLLTSIALQLTTEVAKAQTSGVTVFDGARLITGDGTTVIEDGALVVRDGKIEQVGRRSTLKTPRGANHVDLSGKTVMPMLIDVHGHIGYMKGTTIGKENYTRENILDQLRRLEYYGVGAILSLGTARGDLELRIRNEQRSGDLKDPDLALLFTADDGIVPYNNGATNGAPAFAVDVAHEAATPEQGREYVRQEAAKKADMIKFWDDDRNHTKPKMPADIYRAIIDEGHKLNIPVVAHLYYLEDAKGLASAGISGFAHPVRDKLVDDALVHSMKEHDVFQCTNISTMAPRTWLDDPALAETVTPSTLQAYKAELASSGAGAGGGEANTTRYRTALRNEKIESDAGIRIVLCGDSGGVPGQFVGFSEHRELQSLAEAGLSPLQVIHDTTQVSAEVLGLRDMGTLAAGKRADFIVLNGNPLDDISNTRRIAAVYRNGKAIDRNALRTRFAAASTP